MDETGSDWSFHFKTFALLITSKSLLDKGNYVLSKRSAHFSYLIVERLEVLQYSSSLIE